MNHKNSRWQSLRLMPLCLLAGCMATETVQGTTATYGNSWLNVLLLLAVAVVLTVLGAGLLNEALKASRPKPRKKRKGSSGPQWTPRLMGQAGLGGVLLAGGLLLLLLGVPSCLFATIDVRDDRVVIHDSLFWFASGPREYSYESINDLSVDESATLSRRGLRKKEYLNIHHTGGTERIEMSPMWLAARPRLEENWKKFRFPTNPATTAGAAVVAGGGGVPGQPGSAAAGTPSSPAGASVPGAIAQNGGVRLGRFSPGLKVLANNGTKYVFAVVLSVLPQGRITVREDETGQILEVPLAEASVGPSLIFPDPNDLPGSEVAPTSPVNPGQMLLGFYGGNWYPVKVRQTIAQDNYVEIEWLDEPGIHRVPRSTLRFPPPGDVVAIIKHPFPDPLAETTSPASTPVDEKAPYVVGEKLEVYDLGHWFPCEFMKLLPDGRIRIRLPSATGVATEDVEANNVRRAKK